MFSIRTDDAPQELREEDGPRVGDVYRVAGGRGGPRVRIVVAIRGDTCYSLVYSTETGQVTGTDQSATYYLDRRGRVGRVREMPALEVEWYR